jgi:hypothetical protein
MLLKLKGALKTPFLSANIQKPDVYRPRGNRRLGARPPCPITPGNFTTKDARIKLKHLSPSI